MSLYEYFYMGEIINNNKYSILAIDDSPENNDIILDCLGHEYNVSISTNGEDALKLLERIKPDIILLDIIMPGMDGFDVCKAIKGKDDLKDIPILFLTCLDDSVDAVRAFEAGAEDYIPKPFNTHELYARVKLHIELKANRDLIIQKNSEQKELIHILCHDLANTFTSSLALTALLKKLPEKEKKVVNRLNNSLRNGSQIISMVRNLKESKKSFCLEPINLENSVKQSLSLLSNIFEEKEISVNVRISPDIDIISEYISLINSVLNNVFTNSVKFSHIGQEIDVWVESSSDDSVLLKIRDYGVGIPDDLINTIFDISINKSRKGTSGETGTGFGMSMIKKFMERYGGSVEIDSTKDKGTEVALTFKKGGVNNE